MPDEYDIRERMYFSTALERYFIGITAGMALAVFLTATPGLRAGWPEFAWGVVVFGAASLLEARYRRDLRASLHRIEGDDA